MRNGLGRQKLPEAVRIPRIARIPSSPHDHGGASFVYFTSRITSACFDQPVALIAELFDTHLATVESGRAMKGDGVVNTV